MKRFYQPAVFALAAASLIAMPPAATARPDDEVPSPGRGPAGEQVKYHVGELSLTAEQQEKLDEQRLAHRRKRRESRESLKIKKAELRLELDKPEIDSERVNEIVAEIKELHGERIDQKVKNIKELKEILTPEQFARLRPHERRGRRGRGYRKRGGKRGKGHGRDCGMDLW